MTEAETMEGHLPKEVVQERYERLTTLQDRISYERNVATVGTTHEALVEGISKKDPGKLTGRTRTNKLVHFEGTDQREGSLCMVTITSAHPHHLEGRLVGVGRPAPRSMSLPLASVGTACSTC
jgi:tRNA-2-methylthio-N6-dimethylallyladenosine synthase